MKKLLLSAALVASISFMSCSDDDEANNCTTCELETLGASTTTEVCDNGNGTYDLTVSVAGVSNTETLDFEEGETIDDITESFEAGGATCN